MPHKRSYPWCSTPANPCTAIFRLGVRRSRRGREGGGRELWSRKGVATPPDKEGRGWELNRTRGGGVGPPPRLMIDGKCNCCHCLVVAAPVCVCESKREPRQPRQTAKGTSGERFPSLGATLETTPPLKVPHRSTLPLPSSAWTLTQRVFTWPHELHRMSCRCCTRDVMK